MAIAPGSPLAPPRGAAIPQTHCLQPLASKISRGRRQCQRQAVPLCQSPAPLGSISAKAAPRRDRHLWSPDHQHVSESRVDGAAGPKHRQLFYPFKLPPRSPIPGLGKQPLSHALAKEGRSLGALRHCRVVQRGCQFHLPPALSRWVALGPGPGQSGLWLLGVQGACPVIGQVTRPQIQPHANPTE